MLAFQAMAFQHHPMEKLLAQNVDMPAPLPLFRSGWAYPKPRFLEYIEEVEDRYVHKPGDALFRLHPTPRQDEMTRTLKEMPAPTRPTLKEMWDCLMIHFDHTPDGKLLTNWRRVLPNKRAHGEVSHADSLCLIEKLKVALLDSGKHVADVDVSEHLLELVTQKIKDGVDQAQSRYAQDHHCAWMYKMTSEDVPNATLVTALENHGISHPMVMEFDGSAATVATTSERGHQRVLGLHNEGFQATRWQCNMSKLSCLVRGEQAYCSGMRKKWLPGGTIEPRAPMEWEPE